MTTTLAPAPLFRQWDNNGNPLVGGQLFTYAAGTATPLASYTDSTGSTPNTNPVVLNGRGEASVWLTPNVAYKFVLQDSFGNQLWAVDQIINAQLITLFGGVDTGTANAYVLNFAAPFTSLTNGIIIYWVPANTSTGASTLNVNGLGPVSILDPSGNPILAGEITANQITAVMYNNGAWNLILSSLASRVIAVAGSSAFPSIAFAGDTTTGFYFTAAGQIGVSLGGALGLFSTGVATFAITGLTGTNNLNVRYYTNGLQAILRIPQFNTTSNATTFSMASGAGAIIPAANIPQWVMMPAMEDNGTQIYSQQASVAATGISGTQVTVTFFKNGNVSGWTATGTKGIGDGTTGNFTYLAYLLI